MNILLTGATGFEYFINGTNTIARLGYTGPQSIYYDAPFNRYEFPIDPGVSWNTSLYTGTLMGLNAGEDSATIANGNYIANPDAFGTVMLPPSVFGGQPEVFNDVVRVHVTESFQIKVWIVGTAISTITVNDDYYFWFDEQTQEPILIYGITTDDGGGAPQTVLRYQTIAGTGIATPNSIEENKLNTVLVSPNPSNGKFQFALGVSQITKNSKVEIYNLKGQIIYQSEITKTKSDINLSDQAKGIYFVKFYTGQSILSEKIVIQ